MGDRGDDAGGYLATYLRDHRAGAAAGLSLADRLARANADTEWGGGLAELRDDIAADRDALEDVLAGLGVRANPVKQTLALFAARLRHLKLNRQVFRHSPLSRVVELELLSAGIDAKRNLWRSLGSIGGLEDRIDQARVARLIEGATRQHEQLVALHRSAARAAFGTGSP